MNEVLFFIIDIIVVGSITTMELFSRYILIPLVKLNIYLTNDEAKIDNYTDLLLVLSIPEDDEADDE